MGLFNVVGKIFGKHKVLNKGTFHQDDDPLGKYGDPTARSSSPYKSKREARKAMKNLEEVFPGRARRVEEAREEAAAQTLRDLDEDEMAREMGAEADAILNPPHAQRLTDEDEFILNGEYLETPGSEHVRWLQFIRQESVLYIGFKNGFIYQYENISEQEAREYFGMSGPNHPTAGTYVVWDRLRVRGTVFGHQKDYVFVMGTVGKGPRLEPVYRDKEHWTQEHGTIPASGERPKSWKEGKGPYPSWYGGGP